MSRSVPAFSSIRRPALIQAGLAVCALLAFVLLGLLAPVPGGESLGFDPPLFSVLPFVGMLLSIALFPVLRPDWWERNLAFVTLFWVLVFLLPYAACVGVYEADAHLFEMLVCDYLPFIVLLWGLFTVTGGIVFQTSFGASPKTNVLLLAAGTLLASWVGTTGASMLLIRSVLRANAWREKKAHVVVFFIFLVANIGGCLTPLGDPPLFLGFLRGVPFFWTLRLLPIMLFNSAILLTVFFFLDKRLYARELAAGRRPSAPTQKTARAFEVQGQHNLIFLVIIIGAVVCSGLLSTTDVLKDPATGALLGIPFLFGVSLPVGHALQMLVILIAGGLSLLTTKKDFREHNEFSWEPIREVAILFVGIFVTMIPALMLLSIHGPAVGLTQPWQYFWASGILSSFLDNAPTYLVFLATAGSLGLEGIVTSVGSVAAPLLLAVSAGSVFMGAITYIGNAPNFMVRSIAEKHQVSMPSFFGYMGWSVAVLVPIFLVDTVVFFLLA